MISLKHVSNGVHAMASRALAEKPRIRATTKHATRQGVGVKSALLAWLAFAAFTAANGEAAENRIFDDLMKRGVVMSDGAGVMLPPPIMADGLSAADQRKALDGVADARATADDLVRKSSRAPVVVKVRNARPSQEDGPAVRALDIWFVAHGDWNTLISKEFLDSALTKEGGKGRVVSKSGVLTPEEMTERNLTVATAPDVRQQFVYTTFSLFERVEISATRFSETVQTPESILAAGRVDPRFNKDPDYPNQWRPLLRDERAEITPGPAHPFKHAGGYAKITRLKEPANAVFIECHLVYEEDYGWFDGANLVKQKVPLMVQEQVRTFRRKLALASESPGDSSSPR